MIYPLRRRDKSGMQSAERVLPSTRWALTILAALWVLVPATVIAACVLPSPVALIGPGPIEPVEPLIKVEGTSYEPGGHLYLAPVRVSPDPRLGQYLLAQLRPDIEAAAKSQVIPTFPGREEFQKLSQRLLEESQTIAQIVALRQAGYEVKVDSADVEVVAVAPGTPAVSKLRAGDVIEAANGEDIHTTAELVSIVQGRLTGEPVALRIRREGHWLTVVLPAQRGPVDTEGPVLGVLAITTGLEYRAPINIELEAGPLNGGPSAGLIYALGVYNALVTEDITRGHKIAGAGTLRLNGAVGPVDAIQLKVRAAEEAGAEYFLTPAEESAAARSAAQDIKVIPVHTFEEALTALRQIDASAGNPRAVPASGDTTLAHRFLPGHLDLP